MIHPNGGFFQYENYSKTGSIYDIKAVKKHIKYTVNNLKITILDVR